MSRKLKNTRSIRSKKNNDLDIVVKSKYVKEDLPLPYVLYPNLYGTFIGFSENVDFKIEHKAKVYFCSCSEPAIDNYLKYLENHPKTNYSDWLIKAPLSNHDFPDKISKESVLYKDNPKEIIHFKKGICHKCNMATPTVLALNSMYGGKFKQYYNWYINQQYFKLGVWDDIYINLDYCPDDLVELAQKRKKLCTDRKQFLQANNIESLYTLQLDILRTGNIVLKEKAEILTGYEKELNAISGNISNEVENSIRQEFGFRKIGEGWIGETILFKIIKEIFPNEEIIRHYRPDWLEGLELDVYLPKLKIGLEYQGQQHYKPVKIWGGATALKKQQERDLRKKKICKDKKVALLIIDYSDPLTREYINELIENCG